MISILKQKKHEIFLDGVSVEKLAQKFSTPFYVYSYQKIKENCQKILKAFKDHPCQPFYAVKANSLIPIIRMIGEFSLGADIVSLGELYRARKAGIPSQKIIYSGVGKKISEIEAAVKSKIRAIQIESEFEIDDLIFVANKLKKNIPIAIRVNPNIDPKTNPYIATGLLTSKFGMDESILFHILKKIKFHSKQLNLIGLSCHIGSQLSDLSPLREAASKMSFYIREVLDFGFKLEFVNLGGGLGISYQNESEIDLKSYAEIFRENFSRYPLQWYIEPGRFIVGNAGLLISEVIGVKFSQEKNFIVVDAAMNDLIRPSLYGAYHKISIFPERKNNKQDLFDVVGPVCETGDFLGKDRYFYCPEKGDCIVIHDVGAYGSVMASNYNSRLRGAEILIRDKKIIVMKEQGKYEF